MEYLAATANFAAPYLSLMASVVSSGETHSTPNHSPSEERSPRPQRAAPLVVRPTVRTPSVLPTVASQAGLPKRSATPSGCSAGSAVRRQFQSAKQEKQLWSNRLALLKREVERAQVALDRSRSRGSAVQVAAVINESVAAQLELERQRNLHRQAEKREAIRVQTLEHKLAARQAQQRILQDHARTGSMLRRESELSRELLRERASAEVLAKAQRREAVQLDKVHAMVSRVRAHAMRREEAKQLYEANLHDIMRQTEAAADETYESIAESSSLVSRIRQLKALTAQAEAHRGAQRSLNSTAYHSAS